MTFSFFPAKTETIVLPFSRDFFLLQMARYVRPLDTLEEEGQVYKLSGVYSDTGFKVSPLVKKPNYYLPLASGTVENTQSGQVIFLTYTFFPASRRMLVIWSVITFLLTLFFGLLYAEYMYATICLSMGFVNYILARENFRIQVKNFRRLLDATVFKAQ